MKKTYEIPSVEKAQLNPCTIICQSPGFLNNSGSGTSALGGGEQTGN